MERCIVLVPKEGTELGISPNGVISLSNLESVHIGNKSDVFSSVNYDLSEVFIVYLSDTANQYDGFSVSSLTNN